MEIHESKVELVRMIVNIDKQATIEKLIQVIRDEEKDFVEDLSDDIQNEIKTGIEMLDKGEGISWDDFYKKISDEHHIISFRRI